MLADHEVIRWLGDGVPVTDRGEAWRHLATLAGLEVGWVIAPEHWGNGYASEAGGEALRQAFATLGIDHVISLIRPDNAASIRVAEKLGGRLERRIAMHELDTLVYGYTAAPSRPGEVDLAT